VLFGGRYPRAASIWIGSILVPIEVCVFLMSPKDYFYVGSLPGTEVFALLLAAFVFTIPVGAIFGYLFGALTAGAFCLVDWYEKKQLTQRLS